MPAELGNFAIQLPVNISLQSNTITAGNDAKKENCPSSKCKKAATIPPLELVRRIVNENEMHKILHNFSTDECLCKPGDAKCMLYSHQLDIDPHKLITHLILPSHFS